MQDYDFEWLCKQIIEGKACPWCKFYLGKQDVKAQRYEHDQKYHPEYWMKQVERREQYVKN